MHEMSLMRSLMRQLEGLADQEGAGTITAVRLRLGALSHFSPEHFREHFAQVSPGTRAAGATLEISTSDDIHDPHAQDVVIESLEVEVDA
ncbi:MAG: hydrogenase maturation nickel metallochaperone HypA [Myxococcota bacterium]